MASINSQNQACYVQKESSPAVIPNTTGTATVGNNNACRIINLQTDQQQALIDRPDKLPTLDFTIGIGGRKSASWNASMSLAGNAAGTKPDMDPFLEALFGKAGVVVAATSVTYDSDDVSPTLSIWNFRKPAGATQQCAFGSMVNQAIFRMGQDVAQVEFSGESYWVIDSNQFATAETAAKGGLTSFPAEPAAPVTNGGMVVGFTGQVTLDGNVYGTLRTATVTFNAGRELQKDVFNNYYPDSSPAQDRRDIRVEFSIYDDDSANLGSLKNKAINNTGVTLVFQMGTVAGNRWTFTLRNVVLAAAKYDDSQRKYAVNFTGKAHASSATAKDAMTLVVS